MPGDQEGQKKKRMPTTAKRKSRKLQLKKARQSKGANFENTVQESNGGNNSSVDDSLNHSNEIESAVQPGCSNESFQCGLPSNDSNPTDDSILMQVEDSNDSDWMATITTSTPNVSHSLSSCNAASTPSGPIQISGRRIIDIQFFLNSIQQLETHSPFDCNFADMDLCQERQVGMIQEYTFICRMCKKKDKIMSEDCSKKSESLNLNTSMVTAMTNIGQGYSQLEDLCCGLDMPCMSKQTYIKHQNSVDSAIHDCTWQSLEDAAKEEADLAIAAGCVDSNGIPEITVIVDGAWCKRSYKTNYNALSGVACIIGLKTKKVLFVGVRNSYCCICSRAHSKNLPIPDHVCYKNWSKTSTAMESDIIVEGFKKSIDMYNVKYVNVIGDGDSSVMSKLLEAQPYGPTTHINKVECTNHLLRNYIRKIKEVGETRRNHVGPVPGELRNKVLTNILRLRYAVTGAVKNAKSKGDLPLHEKIRILQEEIRNGPLHVFGEHTKCKTYFCSGTKPGEENVVANLKAYGLWQEIMSANHFLSSFSDSLLQCVTNNLAETYNSIVCKFVAGKRVNLAQRNSYATRSEISALSMNEKENALRKIHKRLTYGFSPGKHALLLRTRRQRKRLQRKTQTNLPNKKKRCLFMVDKDYGDVRVSEPDVEESEFERRKAEVMNSLTMTDKEKTDLEVNSRGQSLCSLWMSERKKRLTASNFGRICKLKSTTPCQKLVIQLLYSDFKGNAATRYGFEKEKLALSQLEDIIGVKVEECGLFIDKEIPYLAASPDGMFSNKGLVEVKCPASAQAVSPEEAVKRKIIKYCDLVDGDLILKKNHSYHYQIQGQLHITGKEFCIFVVWTPHGMSLERIQKDDEFWYSKMETQLKSFYLKCVLPEIIDPRHPRGLPVRDRF